MLGFLEVSKVRAKEDDGPGAEQGTGRESDSRNGSEKWVWAEGLSCLEQIH